MTEFEWSISAALHPSSPAASDHQPGPQRQAAVPTFTRQGQHRERRRSPRCMLQLICAIARQFVFLPGPGSRARSAGRRYRIPVRAGRRRAARPVDHWSPARRLHVVASARTGITKCGYRYRGRRSLIDISAAPVQQKQHGSAAPKKQLRPGIGHSGRLRGLRFGQIYAEMYGRRGFVGDSWALAHISRS